MSYDDVSPTKLASIAAFALLYFTMSYDDVSPTKLASIAAFAVYKYKKKPDIEQAHIRLFLVFMHSSLLTLYSFPFQQ